MKKTLHSMSFEDAVLRELSIERDQENIKETSVYLPKWVQTSIDILHIESEMSFAKLYLGIINHGTAILQHRFNDEIDAIQHVRHTILRSGDDFAEDFLHDFKSLGDRTFVKPYKRTVAMPEWCIGYLGDLSMAFPIEYSASIRLSMCYSLNKWSNINIVGKMNCESEIVSFEHGIDKYIGFCDHLVE